MDSKDKDFHQKNLEKLQKINELNSNRLKEKQEEELKKILIKEKLKKKIMKEIQQHNEEKQKNSQQLEDQLSQDGNQFIRKRSEQSADQKIQQLQKLYQPLNAIKSGRSRHSQREFSQGQNNQTSNIAEIYNYQYQKIQQKQQQVKLPKINNPIQEELQYYFKERHFKFLNEIKEKKEKKLQEQQMEQQVIFQQKRKENHQKKLRENFQKITSRFDQPISQKEIKDIKKTPQKKTKKKLRNIDLDTRSLSNHSKQKDTKKINEQIIQKQQQQFIFIDILKNSNKNKKKRNVKIKKYMIKPQKQKNKIEIKLSVFSKKLQQNKKSEQGLSVQIEFPTKKWLKSISQMKINLNQKKKKNKLLKKLKIWKKPNLQENTHMQQILKPGKKNKDQSQNKKSLLLREGIGTQEKLYFKEDGWKTQTKPLTVLIQNGHSKLLKLITANSRNFKQSIIISNQSIRKNGCITTKVGLCNTLNDLSFFCNVDKQIFYPNCYEIKNDDDNVQFQNEFKFLKAQAILIRECHQNQDRQLVEMTKVALTVSKRRLQVLDDIIDQKNAVIGVKDSEWIVLAQDELNQETLAQKKHQAWMAKIEMKLKDDKKKKRVKNVKKGEKVNEDDVEIDDDLLIEVEEILDRLEKKFPQFSMCGPQNMWILKPASLSRGRGIILQKNLVEIQDHIRTKDSQWVIQKYMENSLTIKNRKFDIRQWVVVTDWNPIEIWMYNECYIRFCAEDYKPDNYENNFAHLANNSIGKYSKNYVNEVIEENMWDQKTFADYLKQESEYDVFNENILPKIKNIIICSLLSAQDKFIYRKNTLELFGFDVMIDDNYNPWLIEINSSPAMDYSTKITQKLVKKAMRDIPKVIVDWREAPRNKKKKVDTGGYTLIKQGPIINQQQNQIGIKLQVEGTRCKL